MESDINMGPPLPWELVPGEPITEEIIRAKGKIWAQLSPEANALSSLLGGEPPGWRQARNKRKAARRRKR